MNSTYCGLTFEQSQMLYLAWVYAIFGFTAFSVSCMVHCCCSPHQLILKKLDNIQLYLVTLHHPQHHIPAIHELR